MDKVLEATAAKSVELKRSFSFRKRFHTNKYYYFMLIPGIIYFLVFKYAPMLGLVIAFKDYTFTDGMFGSQWVGLRWFSQLFSNQEFLKVIYNTLSLSLLKILFGFPAPIILAILLNELRNLHFKRTVQTIIYMPYFISWVIIAGIMFTLLSPSVGILSVFGIKSSPLLSPNNFKILAVFSEIWKESGWGTVVYLAAITGINPELYEAAIVDGANRFQQIFHITLPSILSTIAVLLILKTGYLLSAGFDQIFVLYSPPVYDVADIIDTFVYRNGLAMGRFSYATAAGLFQSVVGLMMVCVSNYCSKRVGENGIW